MNIQAATALSPSSFMVGIKSWKQLWGVPCPLSRLSFPSPFPWCIPAPRVNIPSNVCVSVSGSRSALPFGPVIFGLPGEEKQDLLIAYLLAAIPKEPAGPGSSGVGWHIPLGTAELLGMFRSQRCLDWTQRGQTKPWRRCSAGMGELLGQG